MASCFPIYTSRTGSKRNARESNAILGLNAHSSFKWFCFEEALKFAFIDLKKKKKKKKQKKDRLVE